MTSMRKVKIHNEVEWKEVIERTNRTNRENKMWNIKERKRERMREIVIQ